MRISHSLLLATLWLCQPAVVASSFSFSFYDGSDDLVGSGYYSFDTIPEDVNTAFNDLTGLVWSFDLPDYNMSMSSADGDSTSHESLETEGVYITSVDDTPTLRFFDNVGSYISHNDESAALRTSVRFLEFSNTVQYIRDDVTLGTGTYATTPIPEPKTYALIAAMFVFAVTAGYRRIRRN